MPYTDTLLAPGERMVLRARRHWFMLVWRARAAMLALALGIIGLGLEMASGGTGILYEFLGWLTLGLFVLGIAWFAWGVARHLTEEFAITSRRVIHTEGVVNRRATDTSLVKISDAILTESFFGRIFGFGNLEVLSASGSGIERLRMLPDAKTFKKAMLEARHELEIERSRAVPPYVRGDTPEPGPMSIDEVSATIRRLAELRDRGAITPEEFLAKKTQLLARL